MGLKKRGEAETETTLGLSEALLFATMCIVGLPVDVHIRDGSVYSGTFYTASVDAQYGVVLKEARLTKKGKCSTNVANGSVIRTLVILAGDLVQVVSKGVLWPADCQSGRMVKDEVEAAVENFPLPGIVPKELKDSAMFGADRRKTNQNRDSTKKKIHANGFIVRKSEKDQDGRKVSSDHLGAARGVEHLKESRSRILEDGQVSFAAAKERQICDNGQKLEYEQMENSQDVHSEKKRADEVQSSSSSDTCRIEEKSVLEEHRVKQQVASGVSSKVAPAEVKLDNRFSERSSSVSSLDAVSSTVSHASNSDLNNLSEPRHTSSSFSVDSVAVQNVESNKKSKGFKLNPGAKVFSPSFANPLPATSSAMPSYRNITYLQGTSPVLPLAAAQLDAGIAPFAPRTSALAKVAQFSNLAAGIGPSYSQMSRPPSGNTGSRMQPLGYGGQYHAVQTAPAFAPPNSQAVMVGRLGQLVYVQPDLVQTTAAIPQASARPMISQHHVQYPKHQGTVAAQNMQVHMPSPFVAVGQQPFVMPSQIPLTQPHIPANYHPIPIQGPNVIFGAKFT